MPIEVSRDTHSVSLNSFVGQRKIVDSISISIAASNKQNNPLCHVLLIGHRGSGKSTLASAVASELGVNMHVISMHVIKRDSDLAAVLTNLTPRSVLLIENLDAIRQDCVEMLCTAMDNFCLDIVIGKGTSAKSIRLDLPQFTVIATMDHLHKLPDKILDCFTIKAKMEDYSCKELVALAGINAAKMNVLIDNSAALKLASYAKGSYRKLLNTLKRARDYAIVKGDGVISYEIAETTLNNIIEDKYE